MNELQLYIDFASPASYLALQPTLALIRDMPVEVKWWPFRTGQHALAEQKANETRGEAHKRVRENARRDMHEMYASLLNVPMHFPTTPGNCDLALAALLYTQPKPLPFIQAAYTAYWVAQQDLNDQQVVGSLLEDNGYDAAAFDAQHYLAELEGSQTGFIEAGIVDAPAFVVGEHIFIGREHLPWITEMLEFTQPGELGPFDR